MASRASTGLRLSVQTGLRAASKVALWKARPASTNTALAVPRRKPSSVWLIFFSSSNVAQRGAAYAKRRRQFALRWQPGARREHARGDQRL